MGRDRRRNNGNKRSDGIRLRSRRDQMAGRNYEATIQWGNANGYTVKRKERDAR